MPQDMCDAKIIALYKNKCTRSDSNNHRGISPHRIARKAFASVMLPRLQKLTERDYPQSQCGLTSKRYTTDMI